MSSMKNPPVFNPEVDDDYSSWKRDIGIWKLFTDSKPEKIGPAVYLSLQGKAREAVRALQADKIGAANGYENVMAELDKVFLKDETTKMFYALKDFFEFRREAGMDFTAFIVEYEKRYLKVKTSQIGDLPSALQAFFLLKAANLTPESEKLARATSKLDYADMRDKLMRIFGDPGVLDSDDMVPEIKQEVNFGRSFEKPNRGSSHTHTLPTS